MKVVIVGDVLNGHNGTCPLFLNLADGLIQGGHEVVLIYFSKTKDWSNLSSLLKDKTVYFIKKQVFDIFEFPIRWLIKKIMWTFNYEDITYLFRQFRLGRIIRKIGKNPDLIIYQNPQSALYLLLQSGSSNNLVYLFEPVEFQNMRHLQRLFYLVIFNRVFKVGRLIAASEKTRQATQVSLNKYIDCVPLFGFNSVRQNSILMREIILLDTRWTETREPLFVIEILEKLSEFKFIMHGKFSNPLLKNKLIEELNKRKLNSRCELISETSHEELVALYKRCKILLRWSANPEYGNSTSVFNAIQYDCVPIIDKYLGSAEFVATELSSDLVVDRKPESFVAQIKKIMFNEKYYLSLIERISIVKDKYNWTKRAEEIIDVFKKDYPK